jgi:hypothetical protein
MNSEIGNDIREDQYIVSLTFHRQPTTGERKLAIRGGINSLMHLLLTPMPESVDPSKDPTPGFSVLDRFYMTQEHVRLSRKDFGFWQNE